MKELRNILGVNSSNKDVFRETSHSETLDEELLNFHLIFYSAVLFIFRREVTFNFPKRENKTSITYHANCTGCSLFISFLEFSIHGRVSDWGLFTHPRGHEMITSSYAWTVRTFVVITDSRNVNTNDSRFPYLYE